MRTYRSTHRISESSAPPVAAAVRRGPLVAICLGYFLVILDVTVVTVAVPRIGAGLAAGQGALQWVVDGYTLVFAGLLLFCGGLGDRLGHRRVFLAGLGLFTVASAGCALAPSAAVLVGARLAQGAGAATMVPASLALLGALHPEPAARARAFGVWGGIAGVAAAAGPVLGGVLVWGVGWRTVFLVNVPLGVLAVWLTIRHVPAARPRPRPRGSVRRWTSPPSSPASSRWPPSRPG